MNANSINAKFINSSLSIHIGEGTLESVVVHAEADFPRESCGMMFGHRTASQATICSSKPTRNIAARPMTAFEIDPTAVLHATRSNPRGDSKLIGFYHSHPDGSSEPSGLDMKRAWPEMFYLIVGISRYRPPHATMWHTTQPGSPFIRDELTLTSDELTVI